MWGRGRKRGGGRLGGGLETGRFALYEMTLEL